MSGSNPVLELGTTALELLPERAALCAAAATLFVADLHWGKHASFRAGGIGLPEGDLAAELHLLGELIRRHAITTVAVLGDLIHDRHSLAPVVLDTVAAWRDEHPQLRLLLVPGNHDRHIRDLPPDWRVELVEAAARIAGWRCVHEPPRRALEPTLAGHLHPTVRLRQGPESLRLPAFALVDRVLTLPAFTRFSNGVPMRQGRGTRLFAVAGERVIEV